jgi:hypothetical protein
MSAVSADPPNWLRSSGRTTWRSTPSCAAILCGLELDPVALVIVDRQRQQPITLLPRQSAGDHGIEAARKQQDGERLAVRCHDKGPRQEKRQMGRSGGLRNRSESRAQKNGPPRRAAQLVGLSAC